MKRILARLLLAIFIGYAAFSHYLSYWNAKRLIYASFDRDAAAAGNGRYDIRAVDIDSIRYHGGGAIVYYRLSATYSNGSIKNAPTQQYDNEPTHIRLRHGFFGWKPE